MKTNAEMMTQMTAEPTNESQFFTNISATPSVGLTSYKRKQQKQVILNKILQSVRLEEIYRL